MKCQACEKKINEYESAFGFNLIVFRRKEEDDKILSNKLYDNTTICSLRCLIIVLEKMEQMCIRDGLLGLGRAKEDKERN